MSLGLQVALAAITIFSLIYLCRFNGSQEPQVKGYGHGAGAGAGAGVKTYLLLENECVGEPISSRLGDDIYVFNWRLERAGQVKLLGKFGDELGRWNVPVSGLVKVTIRETASTIVSEISSVHSDWVGSRQSVAAIYRAIMPDGKTIVKR